MRLSHCSIFTPALLTILVGCGIQQEEKSKLAEFYLPSGAQRSQATLGKGYDAEKEKFVGDCVSGEVEFVGAQNALVTFDRSMSEKETSDSLGFSVGGKGRYGAVKFSAAAQFSKESSSNDFSESTTYSAIYNFKNAKLKNAQKTDVGQTAFRANRWKESCGHEYVEQIELGGSLYINTKIEFSSKEDKQAFSAQFNIQGPAFAVRGALEQASKSFGRTASVSVRLYQVGGNISRLSTVFGEAQVAADLNNPNGSQASALVVCSMDRMDACLAVLDKAIKYASDKNDPDAFPSQMNFRTLDTSSPNGPAMLKYITAPWKNLAIYGPDPLVESVVKVSRKRLSDAFEEQLKYNNRVSGLLNGRIRLSPAQFKDIKDIDAKVGENLAVIEEAANTCYSEFAHCTSAATEAIKNLKSFDSTRFTVVPETFAQYCDIANLPTHKLSLKHTVDTLLDVAKEDLSDLGSDPCGTAGAELESRTELNLSQRGLKVLSPLVTLKRIKHLNLKGNEIEDVSKLGLLPELLTLNLSKNRILSVASLSELKSLREIRLMENQITDLSPLKHVPTVIANDDDACRWERKVALERGIITPVEFERYEAVNFGPRFATPGDRASGIHSWFLCSSVAEYL